MDSDRENGRKLNANTIGFTKSSDGRGYLLSLNGNELFQTNQMGAAVCTLALEGFSEQQICSRLQDQYPEVAAASIGEDVRKFFDDMEAAGLTG